MFYVFELVCIESESAFRKVIVMVPTKYLLGVVLSLLTLNFAGCVAPPKVMYKGSIKSDQIVTLKTTCAKEKGLYWGYGIDADIFEVDRKGTWPKWREMFDVTHRPLVYYLAPGKHMVVIGVRDVLSEHVWFVGEPGRTYVARRGDRVFWIEDSLTELPVGGVVGTDDEPPDDTQTQKH